MVSELHALLLAHADGSPILADRAAAGNGRASDEAVAATATGNVRVLALPEGQRFHRGGLPLEKPAQPAHGLVCLAVARKIVGGLVGRS